MENMRVYFLKMRTILARVDFVWMDYESYYLAT